MKSADLKKNVLNQVLIIFLFLIISMIYFYPALEGKELFQSDLIQSKGASKELVDYRTEYHKESLWTNSMFGGMPAYLISTAYKSDLIKYLNFLTSQYFRPFAYLFIYLIGFYIALLLFGVKPWLSFAGAIAYAFSSYFIIIIGVGHIAKVWALGYMPPIIAGVYVAFRGKVLLGSAVTGLFLALQLLINHLQITYYTLLIILLIGIFELVDAIQKNRLKTFFKAIGMLMVAVIMAVASHFSALWTTYEYGKYSIRGKSELTSDTGNKTSGLDKDYATQWSIGIGESLSLLIPNIKGAPGAFTTKSKSYDLLRRSQGGTSYARQMLPRLPSYWGDQPFTHPVYAGAVVCFLFIFGLFVVRGKIKWWILSATVLSIVLSWGRNFPALTNFMLDHFPGYNKFRSISMTLVIAEFTLPLLGILAVRDLMNNGMDKKELIRYLKFSVYITGGIALLFALFPSFLSLEGPNDQQLGQLYDAVIDDRKSLLRADAFRSLIFILLTAGLIYFYVTKKIKSTHLIAGLSVLFLIDLWPVDRRYVNSGDFISKREQKAAFTPSTADLIIMKDRDPDFRVLNLTVSPFQDATTSYFHHSIGGYHGAKLRRYQELIDRHIFPEINTLVSAFNTNPTPSSLDSAMMNLHVLNMLNTRYIIYNREAPPLVNDYELGNVWFVQDYKLVDNADEEIGALSDFSPGDVAVVDKRFRKELNGFEPGTDSLAKIGLISYKPNDLVYRSRSATEQLAVFSEIYYNKGWHAYIDEKPAPYFRADYALRAMLIPAGEHIIEFTFHPRSYYTGEKVSLAGSILLIILVFVSFYAEFRKNQE